MEEDVFAVDSQMAREGFVEGGWLK